MRRERPRTAPARRPEIEGVRRRADAITARILYSDEAAIDLDIAINDLRERVRERFPDRLWFFEMVYEARWQRLREQGWARAGRDEAG
jgi:hypothetical protein